MTTIRFFEILAMNGLTIDELECSSSKKALAKRLTANNANSVQLDGVLRMSGIEIPEEEENDPNAELMAAARAFTNFVMQGKDDDSAANADIFGTLAHISEREAPVSECAKGMINALREFEKALDAYPYSLEGMFQHGMNKDFCRAYNFYVEYRRQFLGT